MSDHELLLEIYNHIKVLNSEQGQMVTQLAVLNNRVEMLEKWFWMFAAVVAGAIVTTVINYVRHSNLKREVEDNNGRKKC